MQLIASRLLIKKPVDSILIILLMHHIKYRQRCLIRTDVDPKYLSGLGKIRIMRIGIVCIGRDRDLPICPV